MEFLKPYIAIIFIFGFSFALLFLTHLKKKQKNGVLTITTGNKDRDIGFDEYHNDIDSFLNQMRYTKEDLKYSPRPIQRVFGGDIIKTCDTYSIELIGPYHMLKILEGILSTPGSSFKAQRR